MGFEIEFMTFEMNVWYMLYLVYMALGWMYLTRGDCVHRTVHDRIWAKRTEAHL